MTCLCFYSQTYSQRRKHYWVMMRPWPNNRASPSLESCFVWALDGMPSFPTLHEPWMECPCFLHPEVVTLLGTDERCFISLVGPHRMTYMPSRLTSHILHEPCMAHAHFDSTTCTLRARLVKKVGSTFQEVNLESGGDWEPRQVYPISHFRDIVKVES